MDEIVTALIALAATGAAGAIGSLSVPISPLDYPAEALKLSQEGDTTVELLIDKKGRVRECSVLVSSGSSYLDAGTCKVVMDKGRFTYAAGARPTKSVITQRLTWRLPR